MNFKTKNIMAIIVTILICIMCLFPLFIKDTEGETLVDKLDTQENSDTVVATAPIAGIIPELYPESVIDDIDVMDADINVVAATPEKLTGYATTTVNIRLEPSTDAEILGTLSINDKIRYYEKEVDGVIWCMIEYQEDLGYVRSDYVSDEEVEIVEIVTPEVKQSTYSGKKLTRSAGVVYGPSGKETYYNLPMDGVIRIMRNLGYDYEYWVREDGVKCFGNYIMLAGNTNVYPKGTIIETSLGTGMICDHCERAEYDPVFDLAVTW